MSLSFRISLNLHFLGFIVNVRISAWFKSSAERILFPLSSALCRNIEAASRLCIKFLLIYIARGWLKNIFASWTIIIASVLFSSIKNRFHCDKRSVTCRFRISANSMLMHSFRSNAIFHAYDDNLKMRWNLSAEIIQIGVTEVPGQVWQTHFQSVTTNSPTFHNMHFDHAAATRESDRTLAATEYRA